jgi:membrane-associated protein
VHLFSVIVALGLDPKQLLSDFGGAATIVLILVIFAETGLLIGFFLPGDSLLFTAGLLASQSQPGEPHLNLAVVLVGCFAAAAIGDQVGFTIGEQAGPRLLRRPDSKLFKRDYVVRTEAFFDRHGAKTVLLARFVPVVRTFAPLLAGVGKMTRRTFTSFNVVGAFIWVFGVTLLGYFLADAIGNSIDTYLLPIIVVIIVVSLIPPFVEYRKAKRHDSRKVSEEQAAAEAARLQARIDDTTSDERNDAGGQPV